ncbi:hypothetical protein PsYK624_013150 [Phanerochaete sordida]|uniref:Uncharacterized protein n=1 Tax=Phanerochaete sordida TaxID=48140 RepID=A0A9P3FXX7_9APHY|nr:hypothetical protein PsYK624_013150 [Phanerochaete sordida]
MQPPPPLELLYNICAPLIAEYIDDLLAGRLKYGAPPPPEPGEDAPAAGEYADPARTAPNPVLPLLQASVRVRHAALMVLSDALGIALDKTGLGRLAAKPWGAIEPVRLRLWRARHTPFARGAPLAVCPPLRAGAPFLQTYERVAFAIESFRHLLAHLAGEIPGVTDAVLGPMERRRAIEGYLAAFPFMQMMHRMCHYKPVVREEAFRELAYGRLFVTVLLAGYGFIVCERVQYSLDWLFQTPEDVVAPTLRCEYDTCVDLTRWIDTLESWYDGMLFNGNANMLTMEDFFDFGKMLTGLTPLDIDPADAQVYTPVVAQVRAVMRSRKTEVHNYMGKIALLMEERGLRAC